MPSKTSIRRLKLADFRNYAELSLDLDDRHVVLTGDNGAGKTNLMEAVSFLSPGRGLRRANYADVSRAGVQARFSVFAEVDGMAGEAGIGTGLDSSEDGLSRKVRINGASQGADDMAEYLRILWLTPAMDGLFTGPASERRRFLDRLVLSLDPAHGRRVGDFERAMRSRNRLLDEGRFDPAWLSGIERQMAELGIAITLARHEMLGLLSRLIEDTRDSTPFPSATLSLDGFMEAEVAQKPSVDLEDGYAALLSETRYRDAAAGRTLDGPHRADLLVRHRDKDMEAERCSTGEQKALLVGLVLAHARLVANLTGYAPILLLDEIAAHLDEGRRAALFDLVDALGGQAFMTGTDRAMFSALRERAQYLTVANGTVIS